MIDTSTIAELGTPADAGKGEEGEVRRWIMEVDLAAKTEKKWRDRANIALKRYRDEADRKDWTFNIYWANVETLMPQLYSTPPKMDVKRRFKDADPVGKLAAEVMERAIEYAVDSYDFDEEMANVLINYCIPSRGVARVRFNPRFEQKQLPPEDLAEGGDGYEELVYAETYIEHVPWDRFRRGPGITWKEVPWVAYEHQLTQQEVEKQFPGFGSKVEYDITMEGVEEKVASSEPSIFKRVRVWEIWDKQGLEVMFLAPSCTGEFLKREGDKLNLEGFFDCERPLYAISTGTTLVPLVEYDMYRDQARELDRVTMRIGRLVNTLKQRGIYDSTVAEFKDLMKAADNEMIPTSTAAAAMAAGGLDKGIFMLPIGEAAEILKTLVQYREQVKQTIYEITGMSDILRGATDADETLGAQQLKMQTGSRRVQRRQRDVQRFIRGLLRKKAQIIAENYTPQLLSLMTGVQLPYEADKQAARLQIQMQQAHQQAIQQQMMQNNPHGMPSGPPVPNGAGIPPQMPPTAPQPIPPEVQQMLSTPSWEDVMKVLKDDVLRNFRIDIETDSTIAADQAAEREQVTELIQGIGGFIQQVGPAVEQGFISQEAAKQILLSCLRRFKFGDEAEQALEEDRPQQPQKPNPEQAKAQAMIQIEQAKAQSQAQLEQAKLQGQMQLEDHKLRNAAQLEQAKARIAAGQDQARAQSDAQLSMAQQAAQGRQNDQQQKIEHARERQERQMEHESDTKKMLLDHKLQMQQMQADAEAKRQEDSRKFQDQLTLLHAKLAADASMKHQDRQHDMDRAKAAKREEKGTR